MKVNPIYAGLLCFVFVLSCNPQNKSKKESITIGNKKEQTKTSKTKTEIPVMLGNKGIGPIQSVTFDTQINQNLADQGAKIFAAKCVACHKAKQNFIGPPLAGIYKTRSPEWVMNMIMNPTEMLEKDPVAIALLAKYNNTIMINQNIPETEARAMAEWFRTLEE